MEPSDVPDATATILYVGNLDKRVTDAMMMNILKTGLPHIQDRVISAKMFLPVDLSQGPEGYCFINFQDNNAACQAMSFLNGRDFCGKKVKVNWATNSGGGSVPKVIGSSFTIFAGDLDDDLTDEELAQAFDPFGEILNAKIVRDPANNKSKNYGFISFTNKPDAEKAIRDMHGAMLKRRPIKTNWATRNQKTAPTSLDYDQVYKETAEDNCTVYVTNLPDRLPEEVLTRHFDAFGKIVGAPRLFDGKNYAFIKFESHAAAATAIVKGNGSELHGSILKCWWGKEDANVNYTSSSNNRSNQNNYQAIPAGAPAEQVLNSYNNQQMTQQQYMQYMQYYQYYMQQYQQYQQGGGGYPQQGYGGYPQQGYPQHPPQQGGQHPPGNYPPPQNYQN